MISNTVMEGDLVFVDLLNIHSELFLIIGELLAFHLEVFRTWLLLGAG